MKAGAKKALIIVNSFTGTDLVREGAEKDYNLLEDLFKWLQFEVEAVKDQSKEKMIKLVKGLAADTTCSCVALAISSHGEEGDKVMANDGGTVSIFSELEPIFDGNLLNKPKLFSFKHAEETKRMKGVKSMIPNQNHRRWFLPMLISSSHFLHLKATRLLGIQ
eukprot:m.61853 g.61853  ORF g.61853 m.61853 type:complete len:163 (+) comp35023_c0_seq2:486-974(+)